MTRQAGSDLSSMSSPSGRAVYGCERIGDMATGKEVLQINGHEVTVTNPEKIYFPESGYTKIDLVQYYLAVADGALRGAGGRPMALKRFVDGIRRRRSSRSVRRRTCPTGSGPRR